MERKHRALLLALPTVLTLLFFFVAPMVYILVHTLHENGFSDFVDFFGDPFYRNILWVTLRVSLVSTAISLVLGYPTAFYMARTKSRMKQVMMIVILFPFLVSAVVRSYGWMVILGTNGLLNQLLQSLGLISAPLKILTTCWCPTWSSPWWACSRALTLTWSTRPTAWVPLLCRPFPRWCSP